MRSGLRRLERKIVLERTVLGVQRLVDDLLRRWDMALHQDCPEPDALDFAAALVDAGFFLPTTITAISYLSECRSQHSLPDRERLLHVLMPWHSQSYQDSDGLR